jgi:hypothetical protein
VPPDVSPEWINSHIDSVFPFPRNFVAFHYDGTNRIQIDPRRAFIDSMQVFIDGERRGRSGQGFYSLGHEMLHYALELRGVEQKKLHHCLMLYTERRGDTTSALMPAPMPALMEEVADHLVEEQIIAPIARLRGLMTEHSLRPCNRLTDEELAQVADFRARLAPGGNSAAATAGVSGRHGQLTRKTPARPPSAIDPVPFSTARRCGLFLHGAAEITGAEEDPAQERRRLAPQRRVKRRVGSRASDHGPAAEPYRASVATRDRRLTHSGTTLARALLR